MVPVSHLYFIQDGGRLKNIFPYKIKYDMKGIEMKKYVIYNNETEMSVEKMFDTACVSCLKDYNDNPKAKRLVVEAMKNKKEIIKVIKNSKTHKIGCERGALYHFC